MILQVRVTDELLLDAGTVEESDGPELVIRPPTVTLFHQVLDFLRSKPERPPPPTGLTVESGGIAAAAVALRWGSYLTVLADTAKPVWSEARTSGVSRISDSEMARINVEVSAALAEWVDLAREDRAAYEKLVCRALAYLPLPKLRPRPAGTEFVMLAMPEVSAQMIAAVDPSRLAAVRAVADAHASRLYANALVNTAWRNGPVEDVHAGDFRGYPLDRRRVTVADEHTLMAYASDRLTSGMDVCHGLAAERSNRSWPEQVLPYGLAGSMRITPTGWTLTEATREVRLGRSV